MPTRETPLVDAEPGSISRTLNVVATMRLVNPRWLVPAVSALEQQACGGQGAALRAGANVITVNFTPKRQRDHYLIYGDTRHVVNTDYVRRQLRHVGLEPRGSIWVGADSATAT